MEHNKKGSDKEKKEMRKITRFNIVFINIQLVFTFLTIGLFIWFIIDSSIIYLFQFFLGLTLLVMAYNNQFIYRRKVATFLYIIIGIILLILDCIMYLGV
ncbi:MAG TPA: hypothetical protein IAB35_05175 [Candidatus Faecimonas gallistercoris]|nr:hypothetical protein [Candidatus Faecimonas gallistercoris]